MPAPARTGRDQIVMAAGQLLDEGGPDAVTMRAVAQRVGVRSPSLYKHVRDRDDLLAEVVAACLAELTEALHVVHDGADPRRSLPEQARLLRRYAQEHPHRYGLVFGAAPGVPLPQEPGLSRGVQPMLDAMSALTGPEHALDGARLMMAWSTGFIAMERAGALRMGGDIDRAWEWGLQQIVAAVDSHPD
jgi:AcrR family transcriptional regulator